MCGRFFSPRRPSRTRVPRMSPHLPSNMHGATENTRISWNSSNQRPFIYGRQTPHAWNLETCGAFNLAPVLHQGQSAVTE